MQNEKRRMRSEKFFILHSSFFIILRYLCATIRIIIALWQKKETARASMRKMVKHLLKKYKYPPEDYDTAISTVISQCEMWTDNMTA